MTVDMLAPGEAKDLSADERWAIWLAKGVERDRRTKKFAIAFAAALAVSGIVTFVVTLLRLP